MAIMRETPSDRIFSWITNGIILAYLAAVIYPILFVVSASISNPMEVIAGRMYLWPKGLNINGYGLVFRNQDIFIGYRNTIFYASLGTLISIAITLSGAYPLSRRKLFGKNAIMSFFVFTMFFSGGLIPTFILAKQLNLYNNVTVMLIWGSASVYNMIVARSFLQNTIDEALFEELPLLVVEVMGVRRPADDLLDAAI